MANQWEKEAIRQLRAASLRLTPNRMAVLSALLKNEGPLTHQQLESMISIDRVTLYRVLDVLVEQGLAHRLATDDRIWRFGAQKRKDVLTSLPAHPHFHCVNCDRFICLDETLTPEWKVPLPQGFNGNSIDITIQGKCAQCNHI